MSEYFIKTSGGGGGGTVQTLTGDVGVATALANNINVLGAPTGMFTGAGDTLTFFDLTQLSYFVVGPVPGQARYNDIQSAINDASAFYNMFGNPPNVFVLPGIYTQNLTLANNVNIIGVQPGGAESFSSTAQIVRIEGTHDPSAITDRFAFSNVFLQGVNAIFQTANAGSGSLYLFGCDVEVTNGYTFDLSAWTGSIYEDGTTQISGGQNGENSGPNLTAMTFLNSQIGSGAANSVILNGTIRIDNCTMTPESSFQNNSVMNISNSTFNRRQQFNGATNGTINDCYFVDSTLSNLFFVGTGTFKLYNNTFDSTFGTVFTNGGSPNIFMSGCTFPNNNILPQGIILQYDKLTNGSYKDSGTTTPYPVGMYESFISVDTSGGPVDIQLPGGTFSNRIFVVKDRTGNAAINPITVSTTGLSTFDLLSTTYVININFGSAQFQFFNGNFEVY